MSSTDDRRAGVVLARALADLIPRELSAWEKLNAETVQIPVWLVGLAGSAAALLIARPDFASTLSVGARQWLLRFLWATIVGSVANRAFLHATNLAAFQVVHHLHSYMAGYATGATVSMPPLLSQLWTREEIVGLIKTHFEVDSTWLVKHDASIETSREAYQSHYDVHQKSESEALASLREVIAAHSGMSRKAEKGLFDGADLDTWRRRARIARGLGIVAAVFFLASCLSFIGATTVAIASAMP